MKDVELLSCLGAKTALMHSYCKFNSKVAEALGIGALSVQEGKGVNSCDFYFPIVALGDDDAHNMHFQSSQHNTDYFL